MARTYVFQHIMSNRLVIHMRLKVEHQTNEFLGHQRHLHLAVARELVTARHKYIIRTHFTTLEEIAKQL